MRNPDPSVMPVMARTCGRCLLGSRPLVPEERIAEILAELKASGRAFVCHEGSTRGEYVICRSFFERGLSLSVVLARKLDRVVYVTVGP